MTEFVVDFQYFKRSTDILVCKELAIVPLIDANVHPISILFKSPSKWNRQLKEEKLINRKLIRFHKISWSSGYAPAKDVMKLLYLNPSHASNIYFPDLLKKDLLKKFYPIIEFSFLIYCKF